MSVSPVSTILAHTNRVSRPLNILTLPTHERYQTNLDKTGHKFYMVEHPKLKKWNDKFAPIPPNHIQTSLDDFPLEVDIDLVLSQSRYGQYQILSNIARRLHVPLVSIEHTLPHPNWPDAEFQRAKGLVSDLDVFISNYSAEKWEIDNPRIVKHAIDSSYFKPGKKQREGILSVVNDWKNRDVFCGYRLWEDTIQGLPFKVVGDNPGLSEPAKDTDDLIQHYQSSSIFYNTSVVSPIPMSLMEAMSCGCAVVSTATCMIPEIIDNGVNGLISNNHQELRQMLEYLLNNEKKRIELGKAARKTIKEKFSISQFTSTWNQIFEDAINNYYVNKEPFWL